MREMAGSLWRYRRRAGTGMATAAAIVVAVVLPQMLNGYSLYVVTEVAVYAVACLGLTVVIGWSGQVAMAQAAFFGIGAYGTNYLFTHHVPWLVALVLIALLSGGIGAIIGFPVTRLRGFYLAIATLAFADLADQVFNSATTVTGGANGVDVTPFQLGSLAANTGLWYLAVIALALAIAVLWHLGRTRLGRCFRAVRDMEIATGSLAISARRYKVIAFVASAILGSVAGSLFGQALTFLTPESFNLSLIIEFLIVIFVGGVDSIAGAVIGSAFLVIIQEVLQSLGSYQRLIFGLALVLAVRFLPGGLVSLLPRTRQLVARYRRTRTVSVAGPALGAVPAVVTEQARQSAPVTGGPLPSAGVPGLSLGVVAAEHPPAGAAASGAGAPAVAPVLAARRGHADRADGSSPGRGARDGRAGLVVMGVEVSFGGVHVLKDVSLAAAPGFTGLIGPNGAGKTTLFNVVTGYVHPQAGTVELDGVPLHGRVAFQVAKAGVSRTFQTPKLVGDMSVLDNAMLGLDGRGGRHLGFALGMPRAEGRARRRAADLLGEFGLGDQLHQQAASLSLGSQKIIEVARAVLSGPRLLLLDEPAAGLSRADTDKLVRPLQALADRGLVVMIVEHDLELVTALCPTVVMLEFGSVLAVGAPAEVTARPDVVAAYMGGDIATPAS